jgi:cell fate regulator YaaT (PSP1 superfamily)
MVDVVGVSLKDKGRIYYFLTNNYSLKKKITVIVDTERGLQFGKVETDVIQVDPKKLRETLKKIVRISSKQDYQKHKKNIKDAKETLHTCRDLIKKHNLNMQVLDANYTFERDQLMFYFLADKRVDFRELAKELASIYKTRIELRQVGVRDRARETGGVGQCGRLLCCSKFLNDFDSVSINMAKNQNLSLNPSKINGVCGRLLCCLKYEDNEYTECRKCLPEIGDIIKTDEGSGRVISVDILTKKYKVEVSGVGIVEISKNKCGSH